MHATQFSVVSSAAQNLYNSAGTTGSQIFIKNMGPDYKIFLLTNSTQPVAQGYPLCKGETVSFTHASSLPGIFARLSGQVGANASTVFSQVAVFQTP